MLATVVRAFQNTAYLWSSSPSNHLLPSRMMPPPFPISRPRIGGGPRCFPLVFLVSCIPFFQEAVPRHEGTAAAASAPAAASVTVRAGTSPALVGAKARPSLLSTNPSPSTGPVDTGFLPVFSNDAKVLRHAHTDNQKYPRKGEVQQDALGQKAQYIQVKSEPAASVAAMPAGAAATPPAAAAPPAAASPPAQGGAAPAASILAPAALPAAAAAQAASLPGRPADSAPSASAFAPVSSTPSAPASPAAPAAPAPASAAAAAAPLAGAPALGAETAPAAVPPGAGAAQAAIPAPATAAAPTAPAPAVPSAPEPTASAAAAVAPAAAAPPGPALAAPATPMTAPQALQAPLTAPVEPAQSPAAPASPAPAPTAPTQAEPVASSPATAAAGATAPTGTGAWPSAAVPEGTGALSRAKLTYLLAVPSGAKKGDVSAPGVATESEGIPLPTALTGQELATPLSAPLDTLGGQAVEMPVTAGVAGTEPLDTKSCFNHCSCTPVMVVAALLFAACCCSVVVAAVMMGNLFSKGVLSSAFFFGGGYALLAASFFGLATGSICGGVVARCWPAALSFGGGTLAFACGIVLLGRRGAWLGAVGGVATGGSIAGLVDPSAFPISLGCVMGLLLGIVIGFAPIFRDLKMNSRYIRHGLQTPDSSGTSMRASQQDYSKPVDSLASHRAHKMSPSAAATRSASGLKLRSSPSRSMDSRATTGSRASGLHEGPIMESAASPTHSANSSAAANKE